MRVLFIFPLVIAAAFFAVACSDDNDAGTPTPVGPAAPVETPDADEERRPDGLQYIFDTVGASFDIEELRVHLAPELQSMTDDEINRAIHCFPTDVNAEVMDQRVTEQGRTATLVRVWEVTSDAAGDTDTTVERTWTFERLGNDPEDASYVITGLPSECPFEPGLPADDDDDDD